MWLCDYINAGYTCGSNYNSPKHRSSSKPEVIKIGAPFTNCISVICNTQINNAKDIDIILLMYDLIEYDYNNTKTSGIFFGIL